MSPVAIGDGYDEMLFNIPVMRKIFHTSKIMVGRLFCPWKSLLVCLVYENFCSDPKRLLSGSLLPYYFINDKVDGGINVICFKS